MNIISIGPILRAIAVVVLFVGTGWANPAPIRPANDGGTPFQFSSLYGPRMIGQFLFNSFHEAIDYAHPPASDFVDGQAVYDPVRAVDGGTVITGISAKQVSDDLDSAIITFGVSEPCDADLVILEDGKGKRVHYSLTAEGESNAVTWPGKGHEVGKHYGLENHLALLEVKKDGRSSKRILWFWTGLPAGDRTIVSGGGGIPSAGIPDTVRTEPMNSKAEYSPDIAGFPDMARRMSRLNQAQSAQGSISAAFGGGRSAQTKNATPSGLAAASGSHAVPDSRAVPEFPDMDNRTSDSSRHDPGRRAREPDDFRKSPTTGQ